MIWNGEDTFMLKEATNFSKVFYYFSKKASMYFSLT